MRKDRKFSAKSWDKFLNGLVTKINLGICDLYILTGHRYMALITNSRIFIASASVDPIEGGYKARLLREYPSKGKHICGYRLLRDAIQCKILWKTSGEPDYQFQEPPGRCRVNIRDKRKHDNRIKRLKRIRKSLIP